jgi:hypothetical protein
VPLGSRQQLGRPGLDDAPRLPRDHRHVLPVQLLLDSCPRATDGRIVLAVDVSPWLRSDAPTRGREQAQLIPGWPYSFVAALEPGRTSWTATLDAVRLGPADDATAVTAQQLRAVLGRLITAGQWKPGDSSIVIVADSVYVPITVTQSPTSDLRPYGRPTLQSPSSPRTA